MDIVKAMWLRRARRRRAIRTITGVPPLTFKGKGKNLKNYRIYGNTVNGESVGDLIAEGEHAGEYRVPVTVTGKNLLINKAKTKTTNGVKFTVNDDGSVTCNGFTNELTRFNILSLNDSGHRKVSGNFIINGSPGVDGTLMKLWVDDLELPITSEDVTYNGTVKRLCIQINENTTVNDVTFSPMIRNVNIEDGTFEPYQIPVTTNIYLPKQIKMVGNEAEYIDYGEQKQHRVRKNLLRNTAESQIQSGVTFTVNDDGGVTCNGTSTSQYYSLFRIPCYLVAGNYTISGCPVGGSSGKYRADIRISPNGGMVGTDADIGAGATIPIDESGLYDYTIRIQGGYTCNNLTFYPMIREADITDDTYEPYIEDTELNVTLPALPTLSGTNTLLIGTEVQPSLIDAKGKIGPTGGAT